MSSASDAHLTDEVITKAFTGTDFGRTDFRTILAETVLKRAAGYHSGRTATTICTRLGLLGKQDRPTKLGLTFAFHHYYKPCVREALMPVEEATMNIDTGPDYYDLERVYDEKISPLMQQIIAICNEHNMPMVASFAYENCEENGPGFCTTTLPFEGRHIKQFAEATSIIRGNPLFSAFTVMSGVKAQ